MLCPEFNGLAPLHKVATKVCTISVSGIELPIQYAKTYINRGYVRVVLVQGMSKGNKANDDNQFEFDPDRTYQVSSGEIKLNFPSSVVKEKVREGRASIYVPTNGLTFNIQPIVDDFKMERMQL